MILETLKPACNPGTLLANAERMTMPVLTATLLMLSTTLCTPSPSADRPLNGVKRVVFLGDSITYAGQWIEYAEGILRATDPNFDTEFLNIGLPSETVSGLSEPGHAGGAFPRPVLGERLDRVLNQAKPDLIVACYGMNDGIYHPFSEERFAAYREGMLTLREKAKAIGAKVLHITPPVFDAVPIIKSTLPAGLKEYRHPYVGYDDVLARYTEWLVDQKSKGWDVIDIHSPLRTYLETERKRDPSYRFADDGVHLNASGHWLIAREVLKHWGVDAKVVGEPTESAEAVFVRLPNGPEILKLVQSRQRVLKDAWLTSTGHLRPGMSKGKPLAEATAEAMKIEETLKTLQPKPR